MPRQPEDPSPADCANPTCASWVMPGSRWCAIHQSEVHQLQMQAYLAMQDTTPAGDLITPGNEPVPQSQPTERFFPVNRAARRAAKRGKR